MSRYRLLVPPTQERILREHCAHARFVWNLAVEQHSWSHPGRRSAPGYLEQCRQLTAARRASPWLAAGCQMVQQQALRDFDQAVRNYFAGTHRKPRWRKARHDEGFRIVGVRAGHVRTLSRKIAAVWVPKVGWVRFRCSRPIPDRVKSYRITNDRTGHWHVAFAAVPKPIPRPGNGKVVGVDRGVTISAALSTGEMLTIPRLSPARQRRLLRLQRKLARAQRTSNRRRAIKLAIARLKSHEADTRKDWCEKASTGLARRFDVIRIEDLKIASMTRSARGTVAEPGRNVRAKAGLNRAIMTSGWGELVRRLEDKAPGRVERVSPAFTSQRSSACGHIAPESRKSQALFACVVCRFTCNADLNAARNIAAGHAVTARGGPPPGEPVNREPRHHGPRAA